MRKEDLSLERQLVLMGSIEVDESKDGEFKRFFNHNLNWAEIIYQLITHRTVNIFYSNLRKHKLAGVLEKEMERLFDTQWRYYHEKNKCYMDEFETIVAQYEKHGLVVPCIKGSMLLNTVYPALESRVFNDIDMLIKLDDVGAVTTSLKELGYIQGQYDKEKGIVVEASRKDKIFHQNATHELQEFQKVNCNQLCHLFEVDINHDILWKGNCPYRVPTVDLINRAIPIKVGAATGYMLDYIDNICQLSCHLYKEATMMLWITDMRDLKIYKFADLYMFIRKFERQIDWEDLLNRVKGYGLEKVVYYNFYYIELMFGSIIPDKVLERIKPADLSYMDEYGIENKEPAKWKHDFFTRLFDTNRILDLEQEQFKKMEQFMETKSKYDGIMNHRVNRTDA